MGRSALTRSQRPARRGQANGRRTIVAGGPTSMRDLPTGTVTFLLTDIEGSTALWERQPEATRSALERHDAIIESAVAREGGAVVRPRGEGDSRFAAFDRASDAIAAACAIQRALVAEFWQGTPTLRVRIALHTGETDVRQGDYYGNAVNRCARLRLIAYGGQVLISSVTAALVASALPGPPLGPGRRRRRPGIPGCARHARRRSSCP